MKTRRSNRRNARNARSRSSKKGGWGGWPRTTFVGPAWNGTNGSNHFGLSKSGITAKPVPVPEFWGPRMQDANRLVPTLKINALSKGGGGSKTRHRSSSRSKRGGIVTDGVVPQEGGGGSKTRHRSSSRSKRGGVVPVGFGSPQDLQGIQPKWELSKGGGGSKTRHRSSSRSKRGGFVFGGFPQDMQIGWDNLKIGAENLYRGFMGNNQLTSASPWNQPALNAKMGPSLQKVTDISKLIADASKVTRNI